MYSGRVKKGRLILVIGGDARESAAWEVSMSIRITCINKSGGFHADPHHAIQNLGWVNEDTKATGKNTRLEIYNWIKKGGHAYVRDSRANVATVDTREHFNGTKYVQTRADGVFTDNLLALPECL